MSDRKPLVCLFLSLLLGLSWQLTVAQAGGEKPQVLMVDHDKKGFVYTLNGHALGAKESLLLVLSEARRADHRADPEIQILISEAAKLSEIQNLIGIAYKAEFTKYRLFVFDADKQQMSELKYSHAVPFSTAGTIQEQAVAPERH